jgi:hypothetical protein
MRALVLLPPRQRRVQHYHQVDDLQLVAEGFSFHISRKTIDKYSIMWQVNPQGKIMSLCMLYISHVPC